MLSRRPSDCTALEGAYHVGVLLVASITLRNTKSVIVAFGVKLPGTIVVLKPVDTVVWPKGD